MVNIGNDWDKMLADVFSSEEYKKLHDFLANEYKTQTIYPSMYNIFEALKLTSFEDTKVVIIGQDPYHEPGQAHGLAFSVQEGIVNPPSLKNIFKEIEAEFGFKMSGKGNLTPWAKQGVLLLNNVLTVRCHNANSHKGMGWEYVTDSIVKKLNERESRIIFVFWGNNAKEKQKLITNKNHVVLTAAHPSPLSAYNGFFGCGHFKKINDILVSDNKEPINWQL